MREKTHEKIAHDLEHRIQADPSYELPRLIDLAEEFLVSYPTMWKALQILVAGGLVVSLGGRRLVVDRGEKRRVQFGQWGLADQFYGKLREKILEGVFKAGKPLPKSGYFVMTEQASYRTISQTLIRLRNENLVHKRRNRWFAGRQPAAKDPHKSIDRSPIILTMAEKISSWGGSLYDEFTAMFYQPFVQEVTAYEHRLAPCLLADEAGILPVPTGAEQIRALMRSLGERYRGAVIRRVHASLFPDVKRMINTLAKTDKPVIYFDSTDEGKELLCRKSLGAGGNYYRLHLDDRAGVMLALAELARRGHNRIGIHGADRFDWTRRRVALIKECARSCNPPLEIIASGASEPCWDFSSGFESLNIIQRAMRMGGMSSQETNPSLATMQDVRTILLQSAPSLVTLLREGGITALLALNDVMAWNYFLWFRSVGIEIPGHLSIVSFDNMAPASLHPISSVDWGFSRLGYLSAHIIIGDIPVRADRNGNIPGVCVMNDPVSIGPPVKQSEIARLLKE